MQNKILNFLRPTYGLALLGAGAVFAVVTILLSHLWLGIAELVILFALFLLMRLDTKRREEKLLGYIEGITISVDTARQDGMVNAPLPMLLFRPETGEVVWSNQRFLNLTGSREHLFETRLDGLVPQLETKWLREGKNMCPAPVRIGERTFHVYGSLIRPEGTAAGGLLACTYWVEITGFADLEATYLASRPVYAILQVDNYEELMRGLEEAERAALLSAVNQRITQWTEGTRGLLCRYSRDQFLFVFEAQYLEELKSKKFAVLDSVRQIQNSAGIAATLSIGMAQDADTPREGYDAAGLSLDMALSRGGDQVVLKNRFRFEFIGGRSKETERRTKVKSRVMANAMGELLNDASHVFVLGHRAPDLDALGAAVGVCAIARKQNVPAHIIWDSDQAPAAGLAALLRKDTAYADRFMTSQEALLAADSRSILVVVDTARPEQVQAPALLESFNRVAVIDHHRRAATNIDGAALSFLDPFASSACELVCELILNRLDARELLPIEATALMAGITLDTKQFSLRTGERTFEAAAFLRRSGADGTAVKHLFQTALPDTVSRYDLLRSARILRDGIAVARSDREVNRIVAAQAADELLNIRGTETSFVLAPCEGRVVISARSISATNVQVILETLGGGGNAAQAGAQLEGVTPEEAEQKLEAAIRAYFEDEP